MKPQCSTCRFAQQKESRLECRFNPPVVEVKTTYLGKEFSLSSSFPVVKNDDWCSKYQQINDW